MYLMLINKRLSTETFVLRRFFQKHTEHSLDRSYVILSYFGDMQLLLVD